jgi:hypothetical protein
MAMTMTTTTTTTTTMTNDSDDDDDNDDDYFLVGTRVQPRRERERTFTPAGGWIVVEYIGWVLLPKTQYPTIVGTATQRNTTHEI